MFNNMPLSDISLRDIQNESHKITTSKGFRLCDTLTQLLLIGTEIQEALENIENINHCSKKLVDVYFKFNYHMKELEFIRRNHEIVDNSKVKETNNLAEELADIVIRVFSLATELNYDMQKEIISKLEKNKERPHLHGKKF